MMNTSTFSNLYRLVLCSLWALAASAAFAQSKGGPIVHDLDLISSLGTYSGGPQFALMAPPSASLEQYRNGPFDNPVNTCTNWVNGNAGEQNSHYLEGWSVPYRCSMTELPLNTPITLTFGYDIKNNGKHALDYLTYFHRMDPHDVFCGNSHNTAECIVPSVDAFTTFPIPAPSSAGSPLAGMPTSSFNALPAGERLMRLYGGIIDTIYYVTQGNLNANNASTTISVVFRATSTTAVLAWGGHIASRLDWGTGNSAGGISGSPYHTFLVGWTLGNLGSQDRSLSGGSIAPVCTITGPDTLCANASAQYCVANQTDITYTWNIISGNATISGSGSCISVQAGTQDFTLEVTLTSNNGLCSSCTYDVKVLGSGTCSIDGPIEVCPGTSNEYCAPAGATSYSWFVSGAGTISTPTDGPCVTVEADANCNGSYTLSLFLGNAFCGAFCSKVIPVKDLTKPAITCPNPVTVSCTSQVPAVAVTSVTASDNCGGTVTVTHIGDVANGTCPTTISRTYQAEDACGNTERCTQIITVEDKLKPAITCPNPVTVSCTSQVPAVDVTSVTASDNCGGVVTITHIGDVANGTCPTTISRTYQAEDACGNTERCTQIITVEDKLKPAITCPNPVTVSCTSQVPAVDVTSVTASDNCGGTVTITHIGDVANGTCPTTISRTYQAEDACGNTERCTQIITVEDKLKPAITCPNPVTVSCTSQVPAVDVTSVTASDNCGGVVTITHIGDVANGTCPTTISRTYQAEDACGNTERCTQIITVEDKLKPATTCPNPVTVSCTSQVPAVDVTSVTASDNCGGTVTITHIGDVANGTCPTTISRTYQAEDACGNTERCTQIITVEDKLKPAITCPNPVTVSCTSQVPAVDVTSVTASDNCGGVVTITHIGDVANGTCPTTISRTYQAEDACGNTERCTQIITVEDKLKPATTCPNPVTVSCTSQVPAVDVTSVTASDNCGGTVTVTHIGDVANGTCPTTISRTYQAEDACGNTERCTQIITVEDKLKPVVTCRPDVQVSCIDQVPPVDVSSVTASDNCGGAVIITHIGDVANGTCPTTISRTYQAEDACGNTDRCTQIITVEDKLIPAITCPAHITVACTDNVPAPNTSTASASDNCAGTVMITHIGDNIGPKACDNRYLIIRTYEAEDACGNTASCSQGIRVDDKTPPAIACPSDLSVSCTSEVPLADGSSVVTSDNCGGTVVTTHVGDAVKNYTCANRYQVTRMYRATDACGNKSTCFQNIDVYDATPPSGICPKDISVSCIKSIPCSGTDPLVQAALDSIKLAYKDNCGGGISVAFVSNDSLETCSYQVNSGYTFSRTFHFVVSDVCGNTTSCSVSFTGACICTYTQGFWGNTTGKANGLTSSQILDTLMQHGPILVGDGTNCGFSISTTQCVLNILPASGASNPLAKNYVLNCNTTIKNTLVGQLIALQLNLRYNAHFRKLNLGSIVLAESCALTSDQVIALGLGADTATIQDLIERTNRFLSSNCTGEAFAKGFGGLLTNALTALNEYWHECRIDTACDEEDGIGTSEDRSIGTESSASDDVILAPNPAFSSLTVTFAVNATGYLHLRVFDTEGKLVKTLQTETTVGSNQMTLDVSGMAPGMYWISLTTSEKSVSKRFVVYRD